MQLDSLYQEVILDHYKHPLNKRLLADTEVISVHHVNPSCGDEITLNLVLKNRVVTAIGWDGVGCSISQASASMMSDLVKDQELTVALTRLARFQEMMASKGSDIGDEEILEDAVALAGVSKFPARIKCALLGWMAFKDAAYQSTEQGS
jgi:nitrogen fixation NifU-like protein